MWGVVCLVCAPPFLHLLVMCRDLLWVQFFTIDLEMLGVSALWRLIHGFFQLVIHFFFFEREVMHFFVLTHFHCFLYWEFFIFIVESRPHGHWASLCHWAATLLLGALCVGFNLLGSSSISFPYFPTCPVFILSIFFVWVPELYLPCISLSFLLISFPSAFWFHF